MCPASRPLTQKQESFCLNIFQGRSQRDAYLKAGYSAKCGLAIIDINASRMMDESKIALRIAELRSKAESAAIGTVTERQKRLTEIYRANLTDFVDDEGNITLKPSAALAELVVEDWRSNNVGEVTVESRVKRLKLRDAVAAIDSHNRMERVGAVDTAIINDNRSITIIVKSEDGKQSLESLKAGKLPQLSLSPKEADAND